MNLWVKILCSFGYCLIIVIKLKEIGIAHEAQLFELTVLIGIVFIPDVFLCQKYISQWVCGVWLINILLQVDLIVVYEIISKNMLILSVRGTFVKDIMHFDIP